MMKRPHDGLSAAGYCFLPGESGEPADWVLRQLSHPSRRFEWSGQQHYDALAAAVVEWVRGALCGLCGMEPLLGFEPALPYATPGLRTHRGPLLLLVCGAFPGGSAGVWVSLGNIRIV